MITERRHSGSHVVTTDGVVVGQVRYAERRRGGSVHIAVINPQLVAEGRELLLPIAPEQLEHRVVRAPFTAAELQQALYGERDVALATAVGSGLHSAAGSGLATVRTERIVAERRSTPR